MLTLTEALAFAADKQNPHSSSKARSGLMPSIRIQEVSAPLVYFHNDASEGRAKAAAYAVIRMATMPKTINQVG